ncbi:MAG TPA: ATPase, T2SS/T4P/T4SS family [Thermoleophilaceae bacterium]|nr:ATPase, T2SS/T4P/T4SS family [Thermoleophilaceae bacterium]
MPTRSDTPVPSPTSPQRREQVKARLAGLVEPRFRDRPDRRIGEVIAELGFAKREVVEAAVELARRSGELTGEVLINSGVITAEQLSRALAERHGLEYIDFSVFTPDMGAANLIDANAAKRYAAVPVAFLDDHTLLVAMADPANILAVDDIAMMTRYDVHRAVATEEDLTAVIAHIDRVDHQIAVETEVEDHAPADVTDLETPAEDAPVVRLVHSVIAAAIERGASDIHFDATRGDMNVRYRIDGVMWDATTVPRRLVAGVVSRIKIMSDLDIAERRKPQDGRVSISLDGRVVDIRLVTLPTVEGESVVMRILEKTERVLSFEELGMTGDSLARFEKAISRAHGAVLVTGPTGSGKSTTLYSALDTIRSPEKTIITIEDPVEVRVEGVKQVQVNQKAGLDFAAGLRSMMRADPDVIMVGEIRDRETAATAIESSLTGHLILSTLHTNDAPSALTRLVEMGIEPFLVASSISCVVAQRLARALCDACKEPVTIPAEMLRENGFEVTEDVKAYGPAGCVRCGSTGFRGRIGMFEVMPLSQAIRELVLAGAAAETIAEAAGHEGMRRLHLDGLDKVKAGQTSLAEVLRVTTTAG